MYEYAVEWIGGKSAGISSSALSTTPRRNVRESSLGSAGAEREGVGERGGRDARERDKGEDAAGRRAFNDVRDRSADRGARRHQRCHRERDTESESWLPGERPRDAEAEPNRRPPAPAYRRCSTARDDERRHDRRYELRSPRETDTKLRTRRGRGSNRRTPRLLLRRRHAQWIRHRPRPIASNLYRSRHAIP